MWNSTDLGLVSDFPQKFPILPPFLMRRVMNHPQYGKTVKIKEILHSYFEVLLLFSENAINQLA